MSNTRIVRGWAIFEHFLKDIYIEVISKIEIISLLS